MTHGTHRWRKFREAGFVVFFMDILETDKSEYTWNYELLSPENLGSVLVGTVPILPKREKVLGLFPLNFLGHYPLRNYSDIP